MEQVLTFFLWRNLFTVRMEELFGVVKKLNVYPAQKGGRGFLALSRAAETQRRVGGAHY